MDYLSRTSIKVSKSSKYEENFSRTLVFITSTLLNPGEAREISWHKSLVSAR